MEYLFSLPQVAVDVNKYNGEFQNKPVDLKDNI